MFAEYLEHKVISLMLSVAPEETLTYITNIRKDNNYTYDDAVNALLDFEEATGVAHPLDAYLPLLKEKTDGTTNEGLSNN